MPKFDSPIGSRSFPNQQVRDIDIPDESGYAPPAPSRGPDYNFQMDERAMRDFQSRMQPPPMPVQQSIHDSSEIEKQIRQAKEERRTGKERLSDGAKRRIEMLLGMTRLTREVEIEGQVYVLQTLKSRELRDVIIAAAEFDGNVQFPFETSKQILARSLIQVAGVNIQDFLNSDSLQDRLDFVEELDYSLATRLYSEYVVLTNESQSKYALKSEADGKEIVEDLKK